MTPSSFRLSTVLCALALPLLLVGCKSAPTSSSPTPTNAPIAKAQTFPPRPTVPPPAFKVFHHANSTYTLTTREDATDEEIEALIWQLRDAAHNHTFDSLKISQKTFDADGSSVWFHIYRGTKCAPEKYAPGALPCGASYHAAGDYSYSLVKNLPWDSADIRHDDRETLLWDPDTPGSK